MEMVDNWGWGFVAVVHSLSASSASSEVLLQVLYIAVCQRHCWLVTTFVEAQVVSMFNVLSILFMHFVNSWP